MASKNELYRLLNVYSHNTSVSINKSSADPECKRLISEVVSETCAFMQTLIDELQK